MQPSCQSPAIECPGSQSPAAGERAAPGAEAAPRPWPQDIDADDPPRSREALRSWLSHYLDLSFPDAALTPGHCTPLEYLHHAFLSDPFGGAPAPEGPADCVVWANRGGGKTFLGAVATALDLVFKPGIQVRILAGSLEQAGKMHGYLRRLFERPALKDHMGRTTERFIQLACGSRAEVLAQSQASVRGTRIQKLRCDEVELFDDEIWEAAQLTTRSEQRGKWLARGVIECFSTMHRGYGLMSRLVEECGAGQRRLFRWGVLDVLEACPDSRGCEGCRLWGECGGRARRIPGGHLRIDDALAQKSRVDSRVWEAEMLSLRPRRTDAIFEEFDAGRHTFAGEPPEEGPWVGGMDFGFRADTVILWGRVDSAGVLRICHEYTRRRVVVERHIEAILDGSRPRPEWLAVDIAGLHANDHTGTSSVQLMRDAGLGVRWAPQEIGAGVALIRARLAPADGSPPRLVIHERCGTLIRCMREYRYDPANPASDRPLKDGKHDHAIDALRYLVYALDRAGGMKVGSTLC
jgi:hypothetical protein